MTPEQRAAYVFSQTIAAFIESVAMLQANKKRESQGLALAYGEEAFLNLIDKYGLGHNSVVSFFTKE